MRNSPVKPGMESVLAGGDGAMRSRGETGQEWRGERGAATGEAALESLSQRKTLWADESTSVLRHGKTTLFSTEKLFSNAIRYPFPIPFSLMLWGKGVVSDIMDPWSSSVYHSHVVAPRVSDTLCRLGGILLLIFFRYCYQKKI